jgi:DNA-binding transcriptional ArsR family regulator
MTTEQPMRQRQEAGPQPPAALAAEDLCEIFHALSNPARLAIMRWLRDPGSFPPQDRPAEEVGVCLKHIQARAGVSQSTASQYMSVLQRAGLVTSTRIGQWTHYKRNDALLRRLGEQLANGL